MITLKIPSISSVAGDNSDGVVVGKINQTNPAAVLLGESLVNIAQILRKDVTSTGSTLTDVTTAATDATTGDFNPFGTNTTMSLGDAFYFRTVGNIDIHTFYAQIATQGVGSWTMDVQEYNPTTDAWESVTGLVDNSNGFKAGTGVYKISHTSGAGGLLRLDDSSPKYEWFKVVLTSFTSVTTAPILSRIWCADTTISYRNLTVAYTTSVFTSVPAEILPRIGDCLQFVCAGPTMGLDVVVTTAESTNYTIQWKYINASGAYVALSNVSDPSNGLTVTGTHKIRFAIPTDWGQRSVTDSNNNVQTGYIVCKQITAIGTEGPVAPTKSVVKTRSLGTGNANGIKLYTATTIKAVSISHIGIPSTTSMDVSITNLTPSNLAALSSTFTIPANAVSLNVDIADISFLAGEELGVSYVSGGTISDIDLILQI